MTVHAKPAIKLFARGYEERLDGIASLNELCTRMRPVNSLREDNCNSNRAQTSQAITISPAAISLVDAHIAVQERFSDGASKFRLFSSQLQPFVIT